MSRRLEAGGRSENLSPKERLGISFSVVTISGLPGCGSTSLARFLGEKYGIVPITIGQLLRKRVEVPDFPMIDYARRPIKVDEELDERQARAIKSAIEMTSHPIIVEAKLAGVIATEVLSKTEPGQGALSPVARILVIADENIRGKRIQKRESEKHPDLEASQEEIQDRTTNRWRRDLTRYRILHPQLADIDPWDPTNKDKFYDFVIDTSNLTQEEAIEKVHKFLQSRGLVGLD